MVVNGDDILVLGTPTTFWSPGADRRALPRTQSEAIGVVVSASGRAAIVPPPLEREALLARAMASGPGAFDVLFFTGDLRRIWSQHAFDSATAWVGRFSKAGWSNVRQVATLRDARLLPDHSSTLVMHRGELRVAYSFDHRLADSTGPYRWPGIVMLHGRDDEWRADTLPLRLGAARSILLAPTPDSATLAIYSAQPFRPGYAGNYSLHAAVYTDRWGPPAVLVEDAGVHLEPLDVTYTPRGWALAWRREIPLGPTSAPDSLQWGRLTAAHKVEHTVTIGENLPAARPALIEFPGGRTLLVTAGREKRTLRAYLAGDAGVTLLSQFAAPVSLPRLRAVLLDDQRAALWTTSEGVDESEPFVASHLVVVRLQCTATRERQHSLAPNGRGTFHALHSTTRDRPGPVPRRDDRMR
jgi:hypothetical protein